MTNEPEHGMGRRPAADARDGLHPMRAWLAPERVRTGQKVWACASPPLNQGSESTCVGHGWKHWELTEPVSLTLPYGPPTAVGIYDRCTEIDEFPGNDGHIRSYGTSTRAGAEVMREQGFLSEYVHAQSFLDVTDWIADRGPVVVGTDWLRDMFGPFDGTKLRVSGEVVGGHCYLLQGVDFDAGVVLMRNSWGPTWGPWQNGLAHIAFTDLQTLIFERGGDAIAAIEIGSDPQPPPPPPPATMLTFADAETAAGAAYAAIPAGVRYGRDYYRKQGAKGIVDAIAKRRK